MEFERAIYRVYERCMDSLRDTDTDMANKYCRYECVVDNVHHLIILAFWVLYKANNLM